MGLCFYYKGKFNPEASLPDMIEEVKDIAAANKWEHHVFETDFPDGGMSKRGYTDKIYGICLTPPECETVDICFLSNGRMSSAVNMKFYGHSKKSPENEYLYMLAVKTQYAGMEIHKTLINLFKYLAPKYFTDFELKDEGEYWETGDEERLKKVFARYSFLIEGMASGLEHIPVNDGENLEEYLLRLARRLKPE